MFYEDTYKEEWADAVIDMVNNLSEDDRARIYYKNNFLEFTRVHEKVLDLYDDLFAEVKNLPYAETVDENGIRNTNEDSQMINEKEILSVYGEETIWR